MRLEVRGESLVSAVQDVGTGGVDVHADDIVVVDGWGTVLSVDDEDTGAWEQSSQVGVALA